MGHTREDLTRRSVKFWSVFSYLLVYDPESKPLTVIAVLHGARDVEQLLKNGPDQNSPSGRAPQDAGIATAWRLPHRAWVGASTPGRRQPSLPMNRKSSAPLPIRGSLRALVDRVEQERATARQRRATGRPRRQRRQRHCRRGSPACARSTSSWPTSVIWIR